MSDDTVLVNGAVISREFFEENLAEAKSVLWEAVSLDGHGDHHHCIVCTVAVPSSNSGAAYKAGHRYLCTHCFERFVNA